MGKFKIIDQKLTPIIEELKNTITQYDLEIGYHFQKEFILTDNNIDEKVISGICKSKGIYFFEIENSNLLPFAAWFENFKNKWFNPKVDNSPKLSTSRADFHQGKNGKEKEENDTSPKKWIPLYIGKSEDLPKRLLQHINGYSTTSSLRLKQHEFPEGTRFRITILYLGELTHYDIIAPIVESELRSKLSPIVGKQ